MLWHCDITHKKYYHNGNDEHDTAAVSSLSWGSARNFYPRALLTLPIMMYSVQRGEQSERNEIDEIIAWVTWWFNFNCDWYVRWTAIYNKLSLSEIIFLLPTWRRVIVTSHRSLASYWKGKFTTTQQKLMMLNGLTVNNIVWRTLQREFVSERMEKITLWFMNRFEIEKFQFVLLRAARSSSLFVIESARATRILYCSAYILRITFNQLRTDTWVLVCFSRE